MVGMVAAMGCCMLRGVATPVAFSAASVLWVVPAYIVIFHFIVYPDVLTLSTRLY